MPSPVLTSLAVLKANWDVRGQDYLQTFVPLIAETIRLSPYELISLSSVQQQLQMTFGLLLPQNVIDALLRRLFRGGLIKMSQKSKLYERDRDALAALNFKAVQQEFLRRHDALVGSLRAFCKEGLNLDWTSDEAEAALQSFLEENQIVVPTPTGKRNIIPPPERHVQGAKFAVGSFIQHAQEHDEQAFSYFETIVQGNMLANAVFLPDVATSPKLFRDTELYFDTTFLLSALGYTGKPRKDPCSELLSLAVEFGARMCCFRHTAEEMRGVLDACAIRFKYRDFRDSYGPSIEYFLSEHYSGSDIDYLAARLESDLEALGVRVVEKPPYDSAYVIDESKLDGTLQEAIKYKNDRARVRDVDSIAAVMRLRKGREHYRVEECKSLFVSTNVELVGTGRAFFYAESSLGVIPPCMTDQSLTNLLWLKKPTSAPGLPRKRMIADAFAATQPDEGLWNRYLIEIGKLEEGGGVTADQYYVLRHSLQAKGSLMKVTLGEESAFTRGTVQEMLKLIQRDMTAGVEATLRTESERRVDAERRLEESEREQGLRRARITRRAEWVGHAVARLLEFGLLVALAVGAAWTFPWNLPSPKAAPLRYLLAVAQGGLLTLSLANLAVGITLRRVIRRVEHKLVARVEQWLLHLSD
jgi:hypothetical protein